MIWTHTASSCFLVNFSYSKLISGSVSSNFKDIWRACIPLETKIYLWKAIRNRLLVDQIHKCSGPTSEFCALCVGREDFDHIISNVI